MLKRQVEKAVSKKAAGKRQCLPCIQVQARVWRDFLYFALARDNVVYKKNPYFLGKKRRNKSLKKERRCSS